MRLFVVVSGLPGSGKSTLARRIASALNLPLIDKDDLLEGLFESRGVGDAAWRRQLSREADAVLESQVRASEGAVLVSFWGVAGMSADSGTPLGWLAELSERVVNVRCTCDVETAAKRFWARKRHAGHGDESRSCGEIFESIRANAVLGFPDIGEPVDVDTSEAPELGEVLKKIRNAWRGAE